MFSLTEESTNWTVREKFPTKSGTLVILTFAKYVPEVRNTLAVSLPEGYHFENGSWNLPSGEKVLVRSFLDSIPDLPSYDLWVCTGGEVIPGEFLKALGEWRKKDAK